MCSDSESRNTSFVTAKQGTDCTNPSDHYLMILQTTSAQEAEADEEEEAYPENVDEEDSFAIRNFDELEGNCGKQ